MDGGSRERIPPVEIRSCFASGAVQKSNWSDIPGIEDERLAEHELSPSTCSSPSLPVTPRKACTAPKVFVMPVSLMSGTSNGQRGARREPPQQFH